MNKTPLRAVIYARFSSDNQREESIDAQVRACREYCDKRGYLVTGIYKDEAKSGKTTAERDDYNRLQRDAEEDLFDVVIMHKIDRNARNECDYHLFKQKMLSLGIRYEYAAQSIDGTPEGQMMENMLVGFAAYYSRNLAKETKKGMNENAYKAVFNGGTPPLGYDIIDGKYVVNEYEAEIVRFIFEHYLNGDGYGVIANQLKEKGWKSKAGKTIEKTSLYDILGNERYTGTYVFNKTHRKEDGKRNMHAAQSEDVIKTPNAFPCIISKEDFERVQEKRRRNRHTSGKYKALSIYLLSGKIICGQCGRAMIGHRHTLRDKVYEYYGCFNKTNGCPQKQIRKESVESAVIEQVKALVLAPDTKTRLIDVMNGEYEEEMKRNNSVISSKKTIKKNLEVRLENLYRLVESGVCDKQTIARIKDLQEQISAADKEIKKASAPITVLTPEEINDIFSLLEQKLCEDDTTAKKMLVDTFVEKVVITEQSAELTLSLNLTDNNLLPQEKSIPNIKYTYNISLSSKKD